MSIRVAVIQHTHSPKALQPLARARRELLEWRHPAVSFAHHAVLWGDERASCDSLLANFTSSLGHENLTCTTSTDLANNFGAFNTSTETFRVSGGGPHSGLKANVARQFAWNNCDAPYIFWFASIREVDYHYYWTLEWDVAWSGELPKLLGGFHGVPYQPDDLSYPPSACETFPSRFCDGLGAQCTYERDKLSGKNTSKRKCRSIPRNHPQWTDWSPRTEDMLCDGGVNGVGPFYPHHNKRNRTTYPTIKDLRKCSPQLLRLSHKLFEKMARNARNKSHAIFCEMRAASTCQISFNNDGADECIAAPVQLNAQARFFSPAVFSWYSVISSEQLKNATRSPMFMHRVKVAGGSQVALGCEGCKVPIGKKGRWDEFDPPPPPPPPPPMITTLSETWSKRYGPRQLSQKKKNKEPSVAIAKDNEGNPILLDYKAIKRVQSTDIKAQQAHRIPPHNPPPGSPNCTHHFLTYFRPGKHVVGDCGSEVFAHERIEPQPIPLSFPFDLFIQAREKSWPPPPPSKQKEDCTGLFIKYFKAGRVGHCGGPVAGS